jgi:hypothetical protein
MLEHWKLPDPPLTGDYPSSESFAGPGRAEKRRRRDLADAAEPLKNHLIHDRAEGRRGVSVQCVTNTLVGKSKWGLQGLVRSFLRFTLGSE